MSFPEAIETMNASLLDVFKEPFTHIPVAGGSHAANGVFDERYEEVQMQDGVPVSAVRPMMQVHISQLIPAPVVGDRIAIHGKTYRISDVQPDGHGWAKIMLINES